MSERPKRKAIPDKIKLAVVLRHFGLTVKQVQFDHTPALQMRPVNKQGDDYEPAQLDPVHIQLLTLAEHKAKTNGHPKKPRSGDLSQIAHTKALEDKRKAFWRKINEKEPGTPREKKGTIPGRPFGKGR